MPEPLTGRDLDSAVARAFGWEFKQATESWYRDDGTFAALDEVWRPSKDIAAAWAVVRIMVDRGWRVETWSTPYPDGSASCLAVDHDDRLVLVDAETVTEAICRAALAALARPMAAKCEADPRD